MTVERRMTKVERGMTVERRMTKVERRMTLAGRGRRDRDAARLACNYNQQKREIYVLPAPTIDSRKTHIITAKQAVATPFGL